MIDSLRLDIRLGGGVHPVPCRPARGHPRSPHLDLETSVSNRLLLEDGHAYMFSPFRGRQGICNLRDEQEQQTQEACKIG